MSTGTVVLNQPGVFIVDEDGNVSNIGDGDTIGLAKAMLVAGKDGTVARFVRVADDGTVRVDPTGTTKQPMELRDAQHDQTADFGIFGAQKMAADNVIGDLRFDQNALVQDWDITRTNGGNYQPEPGGVGAKFFTTAQVGSKVEFVSKKTFRYQSGRGILVKMSIVTGDTGVSGNVRQWGLRNSNGDGLYYELSGTTLQFIHKRNGAIVSTIAASSFDTPVTLDANGHLYYVQYPWLGVADIFLLYDNAITHRIPYIGTSQEFSLGNPDMNVFFSVENVSNSSSVFMKAGCASVFVEGGTVVSGAVSGENQGAVKNLRVNESGALVTSIEDAVTGRAAQIYEDNRHELQVRDDQQIDVLRLMLQELRAMRFALGHATELRLDEEDDA